MTLAHELGHSVHGLLAGEAQGGLMQSSPIALCETASIFGEMITFNHLLSEMRDQKKEKLELIVSKLDDIIGSVVRQISFSNFERKLHGWKAKTNKWETPAKLSVEELDNMWLETTYEMYGEPGEIFTYKNADHLWSYISHFHRPFYVYGYAFGELLTQSLYSVRDKFGEKFEPLYLDMLRAGSTKDVVELCAPFGLNPTLPAFWGNGIDVSMGRMLDEAERLLAETRK